MYYFINQYLLSNNSSIEHAEIKRLNLFNQHNVPAKLVTRDYDNIIHATLSRFGLTDQQLVNMFDFFAGTTEYKGHSCHIEDLNLPHDYQVSSGRNSKTIMWGSTLLAEAFFIGSTVGQIDHVDYFDAAGNISLRQRYDIRGFKAVDIFFGQDNQVFYERYYRPDGHVYLERHYVQSVQNTPINSLNILKNYHGKNYYFDGLNELFEFFLNELNKTNDETNSFIADRPATAIQPVLKINSPVKKYLWIPMNHVNDGQDLFTGPVNGMLLAPLTSQLKQWNGIIVSTQRQKKELQKRLNKKVPIIVINSAPATEIMDKVPVNKRTAGQVIYVGRLGQDKQTDQLINIFAQIHKKVRNAHFTLYGYGNPQDVKNYKNLVAEKHLENAVTFAGYQVNLEKAYTSAQLFIDASRIDSQPLAMVEALNHGVPVVSYDYLYGPKELIKDDVNGYLVHLNDKKSFVDKAVKLLQDTATLQKLSDGAYDNLNTVNAANTWQQWQQIMNN